jgi:hypothetical protein
MLELWRAESLIRQTAERALMGILFDHSRISQYAVEDEVRSIYVCSRTGELLNTATDRH